MSRFVRLLALILAPAFMGLLASALSITKPDADGYSCYRGANGKDANYVTQYCEQQTKSVFATNGALDWQASARAQGYRTGVESAGKYVVIPPGRTFDVPFLTACKYTIKNTGKTAYYSHDTAMRWIPQFIDTRCPKFSNTNIQQGLSASYGGTSSNSVSKLLYTVTAA